MEYWSNQTNVSKEAAQQQIAIINTFSSEKRFKIALDFANFGIERTREWIKQNHPEYSELEVTLEFVRLIHYQTGQMTEEHWAFYEKEMQKKIKKDWTERFRAMMKENNWNYGDIANMGNFKNAEVVEATISRGLPAFAKLAVSIYEKMQSKL